MTVKLLTAAFLLLSTPASGAAMVAQEPDAARPVPVARWDATVAEARRRRLEALRVYARCLVQYRGRQSEELLAAAPGSAAASEVVPRLVQNGYCIQRGRLRLRQHELRGALAEAFCHRGAVRRALRPVQAFEASFEAFRAAFAAAAPPKSAAAAEEAERLLRARWVALCVVRRAPEGVRALLDANLASATELQRLLALSDDVTACATGGAPLAVDRNDMRQLLAEALYTSGQ